MKLAIALVVVYFMLALAAYGFARHEQRVRPANSEFSGLGLVLLAVPTVFLLIYVEESFGLGVLSELGVMLLFACILVNAALFLGTVAIFKRILGELNRAET